MNQGYPMRTPTRFQKIVSVFLILQLLLPAEVFASITIHTLSRGTELTLDVLDWAKSGGSSQAKPQNEASIVQRQFALLSSASAPLAPAPQDVIVQPPPEDNQPPVLSGATNLTINVGQKLSLSFRAYDAEYPSQTLRFELLKAPTNVISRTLRGTNFVLSWTPVRDQANTTNTFSIAVFDSATPSLSSTQTFQVAVTDFGQAELENQVVLSGQDGCIPIRVAANDPLVSVQFKVTFLADAITNLTFQATAPELCSNTIVFLSATQAIVRASTCSGKPLIARQDTAIAELCFTTYAEQPTRAIPITLSEITLVTEAGRVIATQGSEVGRVVVSGNGALLEAALTKDHEPQLILYGKPGRIYQIEATTNIFDASSWRPACKIPMTGPALVVCCANLGEALGYFRAYEFSVGPTNEPPVIFAGADQIIITNTTVLRASVSDDGLPAACQTLSLQWTNVSGPGRATFSNPTSSVTSVRLDVPGTYILQLSAGDSQAIGIDRVAVTWSCPFRNPAEWTVTASPVASGSVGQVEFSGCEATMIEGDSFQVALEKTFIIQPGNSTLHVEFDRLSFDSGSTQQMRDAFEVALVDPSGRPLTYTIQGNAGILPSSAAQSPALPPTPDALFNFSEGLTSFVAKGASFEALSAQRGKLAVDVSHLAVGSTAKLILRMMNNDADANTEVTIADVRFDEKAGLSDFKGNDGAALSSILRPSIFQQNRESNLPNGECDSQIEADAGVEMVSTGISRLGFPEVALDSIRRSRRQSVGKWMLTGHARASGTGLFPNIHSVSNGYEVIFAEDVSPLPIGAPNDLPRPNIPKTMKAGALFASRLAGVEAESFETFRNGDLPSKVLFGTNEAALAGGLEVYTILDPTFAAGGAYAITGTNVLLLKTENEGFFSVNFATPQSAFGFYGVDLGEPLGLELGVTSASGARKTYPVPITRPQGSGGSFFFGIIQPLDPMISVEFIRVGLYDDYFVFDDFSIATEMELLPAQRPNSIRSVTVNGKPVDAIDASGNFFSPVDVRPGQNVYEVIATDALNQNTTNSITLFGTTCPQAFSSLGEVSSSLRPEYGRTSFNDWTHVLYADVALRNAGNFDVQGPIFVGVTQISDPSVTLLSPDGVTVDGVPFYDYSGALPSARLGKGMLSLPRALAFHNPGKRSFSYRLSVLGQLNRPPQITSVPKLEAIAGKPYSYAFTATDPDGDALTYSLTSGPAGLILNPQLETLNWSPLATNLGNHDIRLRAADGKGGIAEQHYLLSVFNQPSNRPPYFVSTPVTVARVAGNSNQNVGGSIFLSGHDADLHADVGLNNADGAENIVKVAVRFVMDPSRNTFVRAGITKFLFVQTTNAIASDVQNTPDLQGVDGLVAAGFDLGVDFEHHGQATLEEALGRLGTEFAGIVVGSFIGTPIEKPEFDILNRQSARIIEFLNRGGGLVAMSQSDALGGALPEGGYYGFLPFVVSSDPLNQRESGNTLTALGSELGLVTADINGNVSHNIFIEDSGLEVVDRDPFGNILSLAGHGVVFQGGVAGLGQYAYDADVLDPDGDTLTYSLVVAPTNMTISSVTGLIRWVPTPDQIGIHNVTVQVDDGHGGIAKQLYLLCVLPGNANHAPVIVSEPVTSVVPNEIYRYAVRATDGDGDPPEV
jgi:hypothetical protein